MTIAQRIGALALEKEISQGALEFIHMGRWLAQTKGNYLVAADKAKQGRALPRIVEALQAKAAIQPGTVTGWGQPLGAYTVLTNNFLAALRGYSAFEAMLPYMRRFAVELQSIVVATSGSTASTVAEFTPKPVSSLQFQTITPQLLKTVGQVVNTEEFYKYAVNAPSLAQDLSAAVAQAIDTSFVLKLINGITPVPSNGTSYSALVLDLATLLASLSLDVKSKVFLLVDSATAKYWSVVGTTSPAFPGMSPTGGEVQGMAVIPTAGLSQMIVAVDASQIFAASGALELDAGREITVELDSAPTSPPTASTNMVSLWQMNAVALKATRFWAAERGRTGAVAVITGVNYGSGSPP